MNSESKQCQNCRNDFTIEPEDFDFYQRIKVPPPTWCPECRLTRRLIWRHNRTIHKVKCARCDADIFSIYDSSSKFPLYCPTCWWSDDWDAGEYAMEVDFSKPFLQQYRELHDRVPVTATWRRNSVDCQYCITEIDSKRCYFCYGPFRSEDCMYGFGPIMSKRCVDSDAGMNMSDSYGCYSSDSIYRCNFVNFSEECMDSSFLFDCAGCTNCFGSTNLRHKQYYLFNRQCTKEEYEREMKYWDLGSYARTLEAQEKFSALYHETPRRYASIINSPNCTGDNIKNSKNSKYCFMALNGVEDSKFIFFAGLMLKDSYDVNVGGLSSQLLYECTGTETHSESTFFVKGSRECVRTEYCETCVNGKDLFGCSQMRNKQYCILNKQYTKEEYIALRAKIIDHMSSMPYVDAHGREYRYGEFFPMEMSPWPYNESFAYDQLPLTKEQALAKGYQWRDVEKHSYTTTMIGVDIPDHIRDVQDSITKEVIACDHGDRDCGHLCSSAFRIIPEELAFYRVMNIAIPRTCPNCRYYQRIQWRTPPKLWDRTCACTATGHGHSTPCSNLFQTAYAPNRKEILYCDACYKAEFL